MGERPAVCRRPGAGGIAKPLRASDVRVGGVGPRDPLRRIERPGPCFRPLSGNRRDRLAPCRPAASSAACAPIRRSRILSRPTSASRRPPSARPGRPCCWRCRKESGASPLAAGGVTLADGEITHVLCRPDGRDGHDILFLASDGTVVAELSGVLAGASCTRGRGDAPGAGTARDRARRSRTRRHRHLVGCPARRASRDGRKHPEIRAGRHLPARAVPRPRLRFHFADALCRRYLRCLWDRSLAGDLFRMRAHRGAGRPSRRPRRRHRPAPMPCRRLRQGQRPTPCRRRPCRRSP